MTVSPWARCAGLDADDVEPVVRTEVRRDDISRVLVDDGQGCARAARGAVEGGRDGSALPLIRVKRQDLGVAVMGQKIEHGEHLRAGVRRGLDQAQNGRPNCAPSSVNSPISSPTAMEPPA